ncbi:MAG TPA: hypothetical protein VFJ59_12095 [Pseudolabrys sp.]|nr:hypothetical protein [Pseudolabrys sp.]
MKITYRLMLIAAFATFATQASAQSVYDSRYEMIQQDQISFATGTQLLDRASFRNDTRKQLSYPTDRVIVLDKRSGQLWAWYEVSQTFTYLGQIFPIGLTGPIARVIQVPDAR